MKENKTEKMELAPKNLETVNPFRMMRRFSKDMERLFEDFGGFWFPNFFKTDFAPFYKDLDQVAWVPQVEVLQNNGQFMVRADLPGLTKDNVMIELTDNLLLMKGERKEEKEEQLEGFYRTERSYGNFYRQVPLPEGVNSEKAIATFSNGVLEITMPIEKAETSTRQIEIKEPTEVKSAKAAGA